MKLILEILDMLIENALTTATGQHWYATNDQH